MNEEFPNINVHAPSQTRTLSYQPDPALCLTPDVHKDSKKFKSRKVRFRDVRQSIDFCDGDDVTRRTQMGKPTAVIKNEKLGVSNKDYVAQRYTDLDSDDLSVDYSNCSLNNSDANYNNVANSKTYQYVISDFDDGIDDNYCNENVSREVKIDARSDGTTSRTYEKKGVEIVVDRTGYSSQKNSDYSYPFSESATDVSLEYSAFSRPEYNSTLQIGEEIQALKTVITDVAKVVEDKLKTSETLRTLIGEKAASRVNRSEQQFSDLISVDVSEVKVVKQAERHKQIRTPRPIIQTPCKFPEPDLMAFFTEDLQTETVDLSLEGLGVRFHDDELSSADLSVCNDVYLHNKVWDGC